MDSKVLIAIVTSGVSIIVAGISLVASIINTKQMGRSNLEVEKLRHELSKQERREAAADAHADASLTSLQSAIRAIQIFKDEMQVILAAVEKSLDSETAISHVLQAREKVFSLYEEVLPNLEKQDADIFHGAKNRCLSVQNLLQKRLKEMRFVSELSNDDRQQLYEYRSLLTDAQQTLRDSRADKLAQRMTAA
ncbi:MAG: hypothetical protein WC969_04760 [Elusimicrobiota bacterium]|jgi:hypothetical protein